MLKAISMSGILHMPHEEVLRTEARRKGIHINDEDGIHMSRIRRWVIPTFIGFVYTLCIYYGTPADWAAAKEKSK